MTLATRAAASKGTPNGRHLPTVSRQTFRTSRELDFLSERELTTQTGHEVDDWALVIVKELIDNGLDACDEAGISPEIRVAADAAGITVADNGPGLPESTLQGALDFSVRASNREAYVAPDRGAQGNALKTLIAMPRVIDPDGGQFILTANGRRHVITCRADPISQRAVVNDDVSEISPKSKKLQPAAGDRKQAFRRGTEVRIEWTPRGDGDGIRWPFGDLEPLGHWPSPPFRERFRALVEGFALFNPHATITLDWFGTETTWKATNRKWDKWKPNKPTSAHWYEPRHLERLIGASVNYDREHGADRLVSEFIAQFHGLTGSAKRTKVLDQSSLLRARLTDLIDGDRFNDDKIQKLLDAMQRNSRPVKSHHLGVIGEDHFRRRLLEMGVQPDSFRYRRILAKSKNCAVTDGDDNCFLPYVVETAFGWLGPKAKDQRRIYTGANWSATIKNPFRSFGTTGEGLETTLSDLRATRGEPIVFVLHLAHPRIQFSDRGKSAIVIGGDA